MTDDIKKISKETLIPTLATGLELLERLYLHVTMQRASNLGELYKEIEAYKSRALDTLSYAAPICQVDMSQLLPEHFKAGYQLEPITRIELKNFVVGLNPFDKCGKYCFNPQTQKIEFVLYVKGTMVHVTSEYCRKDNEQPMHTPPWLEEIRVNLEGSFRYPEWVWFTASQFREAAIVVLMR